MLYRQRYANGTMPCPRGAIRSADVEVSFLLDRRAGTPKGATFNDEIPGQYVHKKLLAFSPGSIPIGSCYREITLDSGAGNSAEFKRRAR